MLRFPNSLHSARVGGAQKTPADHLTCGCSVLATSYSRTACRRTTIGAAAFHCRVRNGNGWGHCAIVTRVRSRTGISLLSQRRKREAESLGTVIGEFWKLVPRHMSLSQSTGILLAQHP